MARLLAVVGIGLAAAPCSAQLLSGPFMLAPSPTFQTTVSSPCGPTHTALDQGRAGSNTFTHVVTSDVRGRVLSGTTTFTLSTDDQHRSVVSMVCTDVFPQPLQPCSQTIDHLMSLSFVLDEPCFYQLHGEFNQPRTALQGTFSADMHTNANFSRNVAFLSLPQYQSIVLEQWPGAGQTTGLLATEIGADTNFHVRCVLPATAVQAGGPDFIVNASLTLTMTPVHTAQPQSVISCPGEPVSFTIVATGTATREWQIGTFNQWSVLTEGPLVDNGVTVGDVAFGDGGDTLTLTPSAAPEAAQYWRQHFFIRRYTTLTHGYVYSRNARLFINGADLGHAGGLRGGDGVLDNNDFIAFIDMFMSRNSGADVGTSTGDAGTDGLFNNGDFVAFIGLFFTGGCD